MVLWWWRIQGALVTMEMAAIKCSTCRQIPWGAVEWRMATGTTHGFVISKRPQYIGTYYNILKMLNINVPGPSWRFPTMEVPLSMEGFPWTIPCQWTTWGYPCSKHPEHTDAGALLRGQWNSSGGTWVVDILGSAWRYPTSVQPNCLSFVGSLPSWGYKTCREYQRYQRMMNGLLSSSETDLI